MPHKQKKKTYIYISTHHPHVHTPIEMREVGENLKRLYI